MDAAAGAAWARILDTRRCQAMALIIWRQRCGYPLPRPSTPKACLAVIPTVPAVLPGQAIGLVPNDILERLEEHARQAQGALAPETERALRKASAAFSGWAATQDATVL